MGCLVTQRPILISRLFPARRAIYRSVFAMHRSNPVKRVIALAAGLTTLLLISAAPVRAAQPLPDTGILSDVPFTFKSDVAIFSKQHEKPSDSRIFLPRKSFPANREPQLSEARIAHLTLL
jgi:hypothetical protein